MIRSTSKRRPLHARRPRRGAVLIIVIAVFAVVMALSAVWAKRTFTEHRRQRRLEQQVQAQWLAEAGVRRAAARASLDPDYDGETWSIAASELNQREDAEVEIQVEPITDSATELRLIARAQYPAREPQVRVTKTVEFSPPPSETAP